MNHGRPAIGLGGRRQALSRTPRRGRPDWAVSGGPVVGLMGQPLTLVVEEFAESGRRITGPRTHRKRTNCEQATQTEGL